MFDPKSPPLVWLFLGLRIEKWDLLLLLSFYKFRCGCGDLKRRDFWDWLFGRGFDVEFGACFKKGHMYMCVRIGRDGVDRGLEFLLFDSEFLVRLNRTLRGRSRLAKKICLIIRPGPGRRFGPTGRVQVCKNPART